MSDEDATRGPADGPAIPACLLCRARKVGCDQRQPCRPCVRMGMLCPGPAAEGQHISRRDLDRLMEQSYTQANRPRRSQGSCKRCRKSKSRCNQALPSCQRCARRNLSCVYDTGHGSAACRECPSVPSPSRAAMPSHAAATRPHDTQECQLPSSPFSIPHSVQREMLQAYFDRIHPLRCNALLHKPTFMHSFDHERLDENYEEGLLLIVFALGAWQLSRGDASSLASFVDTSPPQAGRSGKEWANAAQSMVFSGFRTPTVQQLMTLVLLCEYALRTEHFASAFGLAGYLFRQIRVLGLDTPSAPTSPSTITHDQEIENRVVWASYCIDVVLASGVDRHSSWRTDLPRVPLPSSNAQFLTKGPSQTLFMPAVGNQQSWDIVSHLDFPALNVVLIYLRTQVLSCIRKTPNGIAPEDPASDFMALLRQLEGFRKSLPSRVEISDLDLYVLKDNRELGSVVFLHILYHAAVCDLTRIAMPGFNFPLATAFRDASADFIDQCSQRCRFHAEEITSIIAQVSPAGGCAFDDPAIADAATESAKIQIIYSAAVANHSDLEATREKVHTNLKLLDVMRLDRDKASPHIRMLLPICSAFGFQDVAASWGSESSDRPPELSGPPNLHHLSKVSQFRRARKEAGASYTKSKNDFTAYQRDVNTVSRSMSRQPPAVSPGAPALPPMMMADGTFPTNSIEYAGGFSAPSGVDSGLDSSTWTATLEGGGDATTEDYTQVAEDMSSYLTQTGMDPLLWWDMETLDAMA